MKFGKIHDLDLLDQMQWRLPVIDPLVEPFLKKQSRVESSRLLVGAPAWNHREWVGKFYPPKARPDEYLYYYSRIFNTIELNTTHYRIPRVEQTEKWLRQVPDSFIFCPKVFQGISHERAGLLDATLLRFWFDFLESLKNHCGPCFLQLPPHFDYGQKALLFKFLQGWPQEFKLALEFRHPSWFEGDAILPALTQFLQSKNIGLVISDVAGRRDVLHGSISADFTMIRFVGNSRHPSDDTRAQLWNDQLELWQTQGLPQVIFFVHQPDDVLVPEMTEYLKGLSFFKRHFPGPMFGAVTSEKEPETLSLFTDD